MSTNKQGYRKLPSEIEWLQRESSNVSHLSFFNFFQWYSRPTAVRRFKKVTEYISDKQKRKQVLEEFNKWKRSRAAHQYWIDRENVQDQNDQINENNSDSFTEATSVTGTSSVNHSFISTSRSCSVADSVETITVDEAKDLIRGNYINNTSSNHNGLQQSFFNFKLDTFNRITDSKLLSYESNLQQLLALSNILLIGKNTYDRELDDYFTSTNIDIIRKNAFDSLKFNHTGQNVPKEILISLITIAEELNNRTLTKINAVKVLLIL